MFYLMVLMVVLVKFVLRFMVKKLFSEMVHFVCGFGSVL